MRVPDNKNSAPAIVVLAAGLGTRFGGLKQIAPVGPNGETLLEYSLYDAVRAGFGRAVIVIASSFEKRFAAEVLPRLKIVSDVDYVLQDSGEDRTGSLFGTGHALLAAEPKIDGPFAVINADDFYGRSAYVAAAKALSQVDQEAAGSFFLVAFSLGATLSKSGPVSRAIVEGDASGLKGLTEHTKLIRQGEAAASLGDDTDIAEFPLDTPVSMNFWGFSPDIFSGFRPQFDNYLATRADAPDAEFRLPEAVLTLVRDGAASVDILNEGRNWFGVTHPADHGTVRQEIVRLIAAGEYPQELGKDSLHERT